MIEFEAVSIDRKVGSSVAVDGTLIVEVIELVVKLFDHAVGSAKSPEIAVIVLWTP